MTTKIDSKTGISSLISNDYIAVSASETVGSALKLLRERRSDFQNKIAYLYVTGADGKLVGTLRVRDLLTADPNQPIHQITAKSVLHVSKGALLEEVVKIFRSYSFFAVPVTDREGRLLGIIRSEQLRQYLSPSSRRNFYQFMNFSQEEIEGEGILKIVLKRLPWLLISVTSGLVCAYILGLFIGRIESVIALILFVPIILGLAGSVGNQSAQIVIRGLQNDNLQISKLIKVLAKEVLVGIVIACVVLLLAVVIAALWRKVPVE